METDLGKIEALLEVWSGKVDRLATAAASTRATGGIELHQHVDDLKARRATVQARLDELKAAPIAKQKRLEIGLRAAWSDFETAFKNSQAISERIAESVNLPRRKGSRPVTASPGFKGRGDPT